MKHKSWDVCKNCGGERGFHTLEWECSKFELEPADELAALRAENAELREALANLSAQFDERGYPANTHANVKIALLDARAVLAKQVTK